MKIVFLVCACISIAAVVLICIFMFANGMPAIQEIGPIKFLFGTEWKPGQGIFGIGPMIIGSIYVTAGAMIIGVPIGLLTAVFLAKYCPSTLYKVIKPIINLMAGIPSIIYGFLWFSSDSSGYSGYIWYQRKRASCSIYPPWDDDSPNHN